MTLLGFLKSLVGTDPCTTQDVEIRGAHLELRRCELPPSKVTYRLYEKRSLHPEGEMALLHDDTEKAVVVDYIAVDNSRRKKGTGTYLYELAAKESCRLGYALKSSDYRSEFSEAFWQKQAHKGRASCARGQAGYFSTPLEVAQKMTLDPTQFEEMAIRLPKPQATEYAGYPARYWPCEHYFIDEPCETTSLAGLKRRRK